MTTPNTDPILSAISSAEKTVETDVKEKAGVNWLFIIVAGLVANAIGVFLHF